MKTHTEKIEAARAQLEASTAGILMLARRNEFIGQPVTSLEEKIRAQRDHLMRRDIKTARAALNKFIEEATRA